MPDNSIFLAADPSALDTLYRRYREDPDAVDPSLARLFADLDNGGSSPLAFDAATVGVRAARLIEAYRSRGHLIAAMDPLGLADRRSHPDLEPETYGIRPGNSGRPIALHGALGLEHATLDELLTRLRAAYCGTLSAEFAHIDEPAERRWLEARMETPATPPSDGRRRWILEQLIIAEGFERFLQVKYPGHKRYGMEGSEAQLPLCERLLERAARAGIEDIVLGPMHRGRTTFMATFMAKPIPAVLSEFTGRAAFPAEFAVAGDASFHMGHSVDRAVDGARVHISMLSHPSHVESVIPVALGKARAKQELRGDGGPSKVLGLMMHTDAGFAAQGVVLETLQLARLEGYETGGSIHIVANNQIGFTTRPEDARSSAYCTDPAKIIQAPIFHVNADDPEAAVRAADLAFDFRARFGRDAVIDLVCYRRRGHNELDEPRFTQPETYARIDTLPTVRQAYGARLEEAGILQPGEAEAIAAKHLKRFEAGFAGTKAYRPNRADRLEGRWSGLRGKPGADTGGPAATGVPADSLRVIGAALALIPDGFAAHPKVAAQLRDRARAIEAGDAIGWPAAEALAIGSLLCEGTPVRLSGQDSRRGTFSHRHAVLFDQKDATPHTPLNHVQERQAMLAIHDSPLSEAAVLGFEYGYSLEDPHALVLWEAQFGDFVNCAQVYIDQYIASGEEKWLRMSGLVLLLPHGLEGGGPEHSSARLERFLQLCAKDNLQVVNPTVPANYFHVLRRQVRRDFRKPLVLLSPKSLLRHRLAVSPLRDMAEGTSFRPVLGEIDDLDPDGVSRVVIASGRIYFDLLEARRAEGREDIALVRIEELYPFPERALAEQLRRYAVAEIVWCQEEPENMGAWSYMSARLDGLLQGNGETPRRLGFVGRPPNPSPAAGQRGRHDAEQNRVIEAALSVGP